MPRRMLLPALWLLLWGAAVRSAGEPAADLPRIVFTQMPLRQSSRKLSPAPRPRSSPPPGSRISILTPGDDKPSLGVLTRGFHSACDPCLSFDGTTVLFAGKKRPAEPWNIWEIALGGRSPRRITRDFGDCREPVYLPRSSITPPEFTDKVRWIAFTGTAAGTADELGRGPATSLYVTNSEPIEGRGTVVWRITHNVGDDFAPSVLGDGRLLFSAVQQQGNRYPPHGLTALMTLNWAGTGLNLLYGNHQGAVMKSMAHEMDDRSVVFVEHDGESDDGGGRLARIWLRRPLRSHEVIGPDSAGTFLTPHDLPGPGMLVSWRNRTGGTYGLYRFTPDHRPQRRLVYDDPEWDDIDPIALMPRNEPHGRIPIVEDHKSTGHLQCLDVYESDRPEAGSFTRGDITTVRVIEGVAGEPGGCETPADPETPRGASGCVAHRILGEAPVEPDGSFYVELPADVPFLIQTLDSAGMAAQTMHGWMWVRPGSRRGCIGCHENKELAPPNRATQALIRAAPAALTAPPHERETVDFKNDIMPLIRSRCYPCHKGVFPKGGLGLGDKTRGRHNEAYINLLGLDEKDTSAYVKPWHSRTSRLTGFLHAQGSNSLPAMPPDTLIPWYERRTFVTWIDLGAGWDFRSVRQPARESSGASRENGAR